MTRNRRVETRYEFADHYPPANFHLALHEGRASPPSMPPEDCTRSTPPNAFSGGRKQDEPAQFALWGV